MEILETIGTVWVVVLVFAGMILVGAFADTPREGTAFVAFLGLIGASCLVGYLLGGSDWAALMLVPAAMAFGAGALTGD